jgi:2-polyprenyl-3-methyl-5-hydroxy-6-metoxy-1,4-benzoquinol methylase
LASACELCGSSDRPLSWFPTKDIVKCPQCGLIYYDGLIPESLYSKDYFEKGEYLGYLHDKKIHQRNFAERIRILEKISPDGRLLEIGAAYGFFLELARARWEVRGIDIASEGTAYARSQLGLDVREEDFLNAPDEPGRWDVICLWDTVEHLPHPIRVIEKASRWLKPGGILALTTGDAGSFIARMRGSQWRQIHPPTHLYYFSKRTLRSAAEQNGLEIIRMRPVGYYRSFKSMVYGICSSKGRPWDRLYRWITCNERIDFPVYLNLLDILLMIAKKPDAR